MAKIREEREAAEGLKPPWMFPRTESQAKAMLVVLVLAILIGLSFLIMRGVDLSRAIRE